MGDRAQNPAIMRHSRLANLAKVEVVAKDGRACEMSPLYREVSLCVGA